MFTALRFFGQASLLAGLGLIALPAHAWHDEGHRITARIAEHYLNDKARIELRRILGTDELARGLATAATYLDDHRPLLNAQIPGSAQWHYDDLEVCEQDKKPSFCADGKCASAAINRHIAMLSDASNNDGTKITALRVLAHVIGDIQQPLHTADANDQGGNLVKLNTVFESYSFYDNLHSLWDGYWVKKAMRVSKLNEAGLADALITRYQDRATEWAQGDAQSWIQESHKLAETVVYGKLPGWTCGKPSAEKWTLAPEYLALGDEMVPERLFRGGVRLAQILNAAVGK